MSLPLPANCMPQSNATSKRLRIGVVGVALLTLALLVFGAGKTDRLPSLESLRGSLGGFTSDSRCSSQATHGAVDWSRYCYSQYVTNDAYLCNSVMIFETLHRLGSKADRVMMYPGSMMDPLATSGSSYAEKLLLKARDVYDVKLHPIAVQHRNGGDPTWADSFTKLLAFNQTQYDRVLNVDSDSTILQTMDELFLIPPAPVAMPRAYWLFPEHKILSSQLMLVQPSEAEFRRVMDAMETAPRGDFDMEIVNTLYLDQALILPHRPYDLLTGEFRRSEAEHSWYLGTDREPWDPVAVFNEGKFLHFSDWPVPKPWLPMSDGTRNQHQPPCVTGPDGREDCTNRELWNGFYRDFAERRSRVCNVDAQRASRRTEAL